MNEVGYPIASSNRIACVQRNGGTMKYLDGKYYHVYNRGSRKGSVFFSEENYKYLLRLIAANSKKYLASIIAY
jgi:hypothetical protein